MLGIEVALHQLEVSKQLARQRRERRLVVERETERVEIGARLLLYPIGDELEPLARHFGRRLAGQPFAHHQRHGGRPRNLLAAPRPSARTGAQPHFDGAGEVRAHSLHSPCAQPIGRAHVCTPLTTAPLVCRLLLEKQNTTTPTTYT